MYWGYRGHLVCMAREKRQVLPWSWPKSKTCAYLMGLVKRESKHKCCSFTKQSFFTACTHICIYNYDKRVCPLGFKEGHLSVWA